MVVGRCQDIAVKLHIVNNVMLWYTIVLKTLKMNNYIPSPNYSWDFYSKCFADSTEIDYA